ncbi:Alpha-1-macroglobulin [Frankliniella fusca]|uniref:Alpha-1-macroglobulin n=1 Tax=Frankliniella fusca TaxID=407009 RepID=A0AAE1HGB5_9NEOP|nr:Alpha-1-macroglobulin [Frankliniella fusca]
MDSLQLVLRESVMKILPHKSELEADQIVAFVIKEGVKKEADLRRMTVDMLKSVCDTVDALDLFEAWQDQYGVKKANEASTSGSRPTRAPLAPVNTEATSARFSLPLIDKDSPYIPAAVRKAIEEKKRPSQSARRDMVDRIVDHLMEAVPTLQRSDLNKVADNLVELYKDSFQDTILTSRLGSDSLRHQLKVKFDNLNRRPESTSKQQASACPAAYGCLQWNPPLPEGESEVSQTRKRENLKILFDNSRRHWDWRRVKIEMQASFYLQRKNINGPIEARPPSRKRQRVTNLEDEDGTSSGETAMTVEELKVEWPCLFKPIGMNYHFSFLTGVDFYGQLDNFMIVEGKLLIDYLSSKGENQARVRTNMTRAEARGNTEAPLVALIKILLIHFNEMESALASYVEDTTEFDEVDTSKLPEDKTPHLVVAGSNFYDITNIFLAIDGKLMTSCETLREAFGMLFSSYFIFGIQYPKSLACFLTYVQKAIAKITPDKGTKCTTSSEQKKVDSKVTKLQNNFTSFKDSLEEENNK